jgi:hypothetical protein
VVEGMGYSGKLMKPMRQTRCLSKAMQNSSCEDWCRNAVTSFSSIGKDTEMTEKRTMKGKKSEKQK